jgi:GNAT superfamily N-acetyltransferase
VLGVVAARVRRAVRPDAEPVRGVYADAYRENRELGFPGSAETVTTAEIAEWIERDSVWVAEAGRAIVGAVRVRVTDGAPVLGRLGVLSAMKGRGIGSALMNAAEDEVRRRGCAAILLTVAEEHPFLPQMYRARGYVVVGPRSPQHSRYNEIVMRKEFRPLRARAPG